MLDVRCPEYLDAVKRFAQTMGLADQLQSRLDYLNAYAYHPDDTSFHCRTEKRCVLGKDFAPHSFSFAMYERDPEQPDNPDAWKFWFQGGLIYQGPDSPANGSGPSFTVSLAEGTGWFVHT